ncbi:hypothetical protein DVH24_042651 [Malus domestica]|uniref:Serine hydroxymethyltransferase-like domain-containing protein n=1 Tax=Malus domestica TaxID=3750 RepID=A0A498I0L1_MALDO|nr:hypothetical protein DVH24_042651 [Malus domestica]
MVYTEAQPGLFLGFNSHHNTASSNSVQSVPLQLLDQNEEKIRAESGDDRDGDEKFNLLGHSICPKRTRDGSGKGPKLRKQGMYHTDADGSNHYDFEEKINFAVFPSLQGGPHNNHIAALAIALKQVATPEYKAYMQQVKKNAQALANALLRRKCRLVTGGTDNHLLLWDLTAVGLTGKNYEKVCEMCHITLNKTAIFGDNGAFSPGGVRIGTPAMTTRGCVESDFETIADFLLRAAQITVCIQREYGKFQKDFIKGLHNNKDIVELRNRVETFAYQFEMPGYD